MKFIKDNFKVIKMVSSHSFTPPLEDIPVLNAFAILMTHDARKTVVMTEHCVVLVNDASCLHSHVIWLASFFLKFKPLVLQSLASTKRRGFIGLLVNGNKGLASSVWL